jgi:hypothetical protein
MRNPSGFCGMSSMSKSDFAFTIAASRLSVELNPAENIWQFLRQNHLSNRVFENYTDIVDACCAEWNAIISEPKRVTSTATRDRASVSP